MIHFSHIRIALSSAEALRASPPTPGDSESGPPSLLHEGQALNPQVLRCLILLTAESGLRKLLSSEQCAPAAKGRVVASPEK